MQKCQLQHQRPMDTDIKAEGQGITTRTRAKSKKSGDQRVLEPK